MLVLSDYIFKRELKPLEKHLSLEDLLVGAKKVLKGLGQEVAFSGDYRFFKVRIGSRVKGRMIVFAVAGKKVVPLLIRLKKDKQIGMNMAASNPMVVKKVKQNLENVIGDIEKGNFREFEI